MLGTVGDHTHTSITSITRLYHVDYTLFLYLYLYKYGIECAIIVNLNETDCECLTNSICE